MATTNIKDLTAPNFNSYSFTLTADTDEIEYGEAIRNRTFTINITGLTADAIEIYGSLTSITPSYVQIFDSLGDNPFTTDGMHQVDVAPYGKIKIVRAGGADGTISGQISLSGRI